VRKQSGSGRGQDHRPGAGRRRTARGNAAGRSVHHHNPGPRRARHQAQYPVHRHRRHCGGGPAVAPVLRRLHRGYVRL
ncbi:hypothetical protein, partial [Arthrobacter sp. DR-2P]